MSLQIRSFELPPIGTQCYAVADTMRLEVVVFDAPLNAYASVEKLAVESGLEITGLYFTHGHWDHTLDGMRFNTENVETYAHPGDRELFENPEVMSAFTIPGLEIPPVSISRWLEHGEQLEILGRPVEVRHVPGHSAGSVLYWFSKDGFAISGDAVFKGSIGRTDFPGCSFEQLEASILKQIYSLPDETLLYPGHGGKTSVGEEATGNAFVTR